MKRQRDHAEFRALIALFAGALSTGGAGILVRLSETGPTATAFWRGGPAAALAAAPGSTPAVPSRAQATATAASLFW